MNYRLAVNKTGSMLRWYVCTMGWKPGNNVGMCSCLLFWLREVMMYVTVLLYSHNTC